MGLCGERDVHKRRDAVREKLAIKKMAGATGLEPATSAVTGQRSNQLSYAPAKNGSQNVCQLPTNRQQVCDVFSKKKDSRARSQCKGRGITLQGIDFAQLDHAHYPVTETVFFLIVKEIRNDCSLPTLKDFQEIWTTGSSRLRSEIDALHWRGPRVNAQTKLFHGMLPTSGKSNRLGLIFRVYFGFDKQ